METFSILYRIELTVTSEKKGVRRAGAGHFQYPLSDRTHCNSG